MKFALRRREGELTALLSTAVSTGPIYPRLGNYVKDKIVPTMVDFALFSCFLDYMEL